MNHTHSGSRPFIALDVAIQAATSCLELVSCVRGAPGDLTSQVSRAATSVPLNLSEGSGRNGRDMTHHYRIAYSSAREASTGIELLLACGRVDEGTAGKAQALLDRTRALIWRLMHSGGNR